MTVPRHLKLARRRCLVDVPELEYPWVITTLLPAVGIGLIMWAAALAGVR